MKHRLTDTKDVIVNEVPFVDRHPFLDPPKVIAVIFLAFFVTLIFAYNFDGWGHGNMITAIVSVYLIITGFFWIVLSHVKKLILAGEFENTLFAGASNAGVEFSIITDSNGKLAYLSPGCRRYFRGDIDIKQKTFEGILTEMGLDDMDRINIISSFKANMRTTRSVQLFDAFGFIQDVYLVLRPISRPKGYQILKAIKLEEELKQELEKKNRADPYIVQIINHIPLPGYITNEKGQILYTNDMFSSLLGYNSGEIVSEELSLKDVIYGQEVMKRDMHSQWDGVLALRHKTTGKPIKKNIHQISVAHSENTNPLICGFVVPKKQKEESSSDPMEINNALNEIWINVLDNAPISIAFFDVEGNITQTNSSFRKMVNRDAKSGWNIREIVSASQKTILEEKIKEVITSVTANTVSPIEINIYNNNSSNALLYLSSVGDEGDIYVAHLVDTTQQKTFEQRMVQSQKMQAVGQLAGGIAHDFNNLLTAMIGFCDLLLIKHPAGDPSFPDIMQIKQNANRAANLVRQLLAFSRKQTLQPQILNVTEVLAELSNLITRLIGENIEFKIIYGQSLDFVRVDKVQFEQVIINLAVNARDAMRKGGILTFKTKNIQIDKKMPSSRRNISGVGDEVIVDGKYVLIEVEDNGEGIPQDIIGKIFDPFFSTKETGSGTGLGLATVHGIIKQTGGYIYVSSEVGKGTVFSIYIPAVEASEAAKHNKEFEKQKEKTEQDLTGKGVVLLVEDEAPVRMFSARALVNKGYQVLEAENGAQALKIIDEVSGKIDIIVTDVMMPVMDGPTMINTVRKQYPNMKVIFISGYGEDAFGKTFGNERDFNFLPKPYSLKDLAGKVKEVISK